MSVHQEVESFALQQFVILQSNYGFSPPQVRRKGWITWIDSIRGEIAVELEIDWREFDVFLLIVRAETGRLPKGYYISDGKRCRVHLLNLLREKEWGVDHVLVSQVRSGSSDPRRRDAASLQSKTAVYFRLLLSCINQILAEGERLFE